MNIRVAIVEDDKRIREGLTTLINGSPGFECKNIFETAEEAIKNISREVDVYLMDINLPGISGIECVKIIREKKPNVQIVMQTVYENDEEIYQSLLAGANGYLLKTTPPVKLLEAIMDVYNGGSPMSSQIARKVVNAFSKMEKPSESDYEFSQREGEILSLLAKGFRYKEIAEKLFISVETVRKHIHNIYKKLHVRSKTEAVLKYLQR
jgi:DNA-binding NarL/FixJ family response regulator